MAQSLKEFSQGFFLVAGDGKGVGTPEFHRMVKVSEKKIGRGKGKTVAFINIPAVIHSVDVESADATQALQPMIIDCIEELQRDIITRMQRDGIKSVTPKDIGLPACMEEWTNRTFSAETVGLWFDNEVAELLAYQIILNRGFDAENLTAKQQESIESRVATYRASYCITAAKFLGIGPDVCAELIRVIELLELTGPIVERIKDKIIPKPMNESLGFA